MTDFTDYVECALDPVGAADRIRALIAERDRYRAVLEAAGYGDLDGIGSASLDHCWALGAEVARRSMVVIIERDRVRRLYHAEAETAHAEMDRADRAEAEVERLRAALQDIANSDDIETHLIRSGTSGWRVPPSRRRTSHDRSRPRRAGGLDRCHLAQGG